MLSIFRFPAISNHKLLTFTVLILQFIYNGFAIECFVCDSTENPSCADLENNSSLRAENCTLENMKSSNSWLFTLNALAFYKTGAYSNPRFNCQKVVARDPTLNKNVTARFCQLHTAESDACEILKNKMLKHKAELQNYDKRDLLIHCSICTEDRCNGSDQLSASKWSLIFLLPLMFQQLSSW